MKFLQDAKTKTDPKAKPSITKTIGLFSSPQVIFLWNEPLLPAEVIAVKRFFVVAYAGAYKKCSPDTLAIPLTKTLEQYFSDEFEHEWKKIRTQKDNKRIHYLIARYHDHPIGFIACELNQKSGHIYIRWATIAPGFQRLGIGKKMFKAVAIHFPDSLGIELYTRKTNSSQNFYKKSNFKEVIHFDFSEPKDDKEIPTFIKRWLNNKNVFYPPQDEAFPSEDSSYFIGFTKKL